MSLPNSLKSFLTSLLLAIILTGAFAPTLFGQVTAAVPSKKTVKDYPHTGEPLMPEVTDQLHAVRRNS